MKGIFSAIVLLIGTLALLTFFGGIETCNLANYSFNELFLPARVRIVTRTPAEIKTNNNWTFEKADGQCRVVGIGNNGTTWTADFIDGSWLVDGQRFPSNRKAGPKKELVRIISLEPDREVNFVTRECHIKEGLFLFTCE